MSEILIINYGIGNLTSVKNMLKKAGAKDVLISSDPQEMKEADKLILPGVGHFDFGMRQLRQSGMVDILNRRVLEDKVSILGICLGAQMMTKGSEEGDEPGLGWVDAYTRRFRQEALPPGYKVPHMGWSELEVRQAGHPLFSDFVPLQRFYFVHSYHIVCNRAQDELASCVYGYPFTAAIAKGNIMGVQFHPEKSHKFGLQLMRNFVNNY